MFLKNTDGILPPRTYVGEDVTTKTQGHFAFRHAAGVVTDVYSAGDPNGTKNLTEAAIYFSGILNQQGQRLRILSTREFQAPEWEKANQTLEAQGLIPPRTPFVGGKG